MMLLSNNSSASVAQKYFLTYNSLRFDPHRVGILNFLPETGIRGDGGAEPQSLVFVPKYTCAKSQNPSTVQMLLRQMYC